jgi:hypothetical protein
MLGGLTATDLIVIGMTGMSIRVVLMKTDLFGHLPIAGIGAMIGINEIGDEIDPVGIGDKTDMTGMGGTTEILDLGFLLEIRF